MWSHCPGVPEGSGVTALGHLFRIIGPFSFKVVERGEGIIWESGKEVIGVGSIKWRHREVVVQGVVGLVVFLLHQESMQSEVFYRDYPCPCSWRGDVLTAVPGREEERGEDERNS